jgi:hypothetical protein
MGRYPYFEAQCFYSNKCESSPDVERGQGLGDGTEKRGAETGRQIYILGSGDFLMMHLPQRIAMLKEQKKAGGKA